MKAKERRVNPEDGCEYTLGELLFLLAGEYEPEEIRRYWEANCTCSPAAQNVHNHAELPRRVCPWQRKAYTLAELQDVFCRIGKFSQDEVEEYWRDRCWPISPAGQTPATPSATSTGSGSASDGFKQPLQKAAGSSKRQSQALAGGRLAAGLSGKSVGNDLFRQGHFEAAKQEYTGALASLTSVSCTSEDEAALRAQLLNNRAACEQQLRNWEAVVRDTTAVLELEGHNPKALLRRAIAAEALGESSMAYSDASAVLAMEPGHPQAQAIRSRTRDLRRETGEARSRPAGKHLEPGSNGVPRLEQSLQNFRYDDMEVLQRGFPWGATDFLSGQEENLHTLQRFEDELANQAHTSPPFWWGLDDAMEDPEILRMALDILVAYLKNYQLDRCQSVARYVLPAARQRGLPWNVKALQDCATLRMKQARQAEAVLLLEEINQYVPPNPIHCKNLGVAYNQLRQHHRALECFQEAVRLQEGVMLPGDYWDIGIVHKHLRHFDKALPALLDALSGFRAEQADPVTIAKITDNVGTCYLEMGKAFKRQEQYALWAEPHLREAEGLYRKVIGIDSPLYGSCVRSLAQAMQWQSNFEAAETWLMEALRIEVEKDAIHPTPIHDLLDDLLDLAGSLRLKSLVAYHGLVHQAVRNLEMRGLCDDGNGGMVLHKAARFLSISGPDFRPSALDYYCRALVLIRSHKDPPVDTSGHCRILEMEIQLCRQLLESRPLAILDGVQSADQLSGCQQNKDLK